MRIIKTLIELQGQELDRRLVCIENYTVRGRIDKNFYDQVVEFTKPQDDQDAAKQDEVPIRRFKQYLIDQI